MNHVPPYSIIPLIMLVENENDPKTNIAEETLARLPLIVHGTTPTPTAQEKFAYQITNIISPIEVASHFVPIYLDRIEAIVPVFDPRLMDRFLPRVSNPHGEASLFMHPQKGLIGYCSCQDEKSAQEYTGYTLHYYTSEENFEKTRRFLIKQYQTTYQGKNSGRFRYSEIEMIPGFSTMFQFVNSKHKHQLVLHSEPSFVGDLPIEYSRASKLALETKLLSRRDSPKLSPLEYQQIPLVTEISPEEKAPIEVFALSAVPLLDLIDCTILYNDTCIYGETDHSFQKRKSLGSFEIRYTGKAHTPEIDLFLAILNAHLWTPFKLENMEAAGTANFYGEQRKHYKDLDFDMQRDQTGALVSNPSSNIKTFLKVEDDRTRVRGRLYWNILVDPKNYERVVNCIGNLSEGEVKTIDPFHTSVKAYFVGGYAYYVNISKAAW